MANPFPAGLVAAYVQGIIVARVTCTFLLVAWESRIARPADLC
jgi:hypothetical protein